MTPNGFYSFMSEYNYNAILGAYETMQNRSIVSFLDNPTYENNRKAILDSLLVKAKDAGEINGS